VCTAIARVLGTLAGAALAALLVSLVGSKPAEVTALVWGGYSLFRANYTAFTVCITGRAQPLRRRPRPQPARRVRL